MGRVKHLRAPLKPKYTVITSVQTLPITLINNSLLLDTVKIKFVMSKYIHYYFEDRICKWPFGTTNQLWWAKYCERKKI